MNNLKKFYNGKRVFITGHTGFKGTWLTLWLILLGAKVCGFSNKDKTNPSFFEILKNFLIGAWVKNNLRLCTQDK